MERDNGIVKVKRRFDLAEVENGWIVREVDYNIYMGGLLPSSRMWIVKRPEDIPYVINEAISSEKKA